MATFFDQAAAQVAPIYDQQIAQAQAQIPALQKLYQSLIGNLQTQSQQQLASGTQNIVEDASRRGVLRSSLPVDARTTLQGQLSAALTQGTADLNRQQMGDISGIQERIGSLQTGRLGAIQSLADQLYQRDLAEREFQMKQQQAAAEAAAARSGGAAKPLKFQDAAAYAATYMQGKAGKDGYVSPDVYKRVKNDFLAQGFTDKQWQSFALRYKNPKNRFY